MMTLTIMRRVRFCAGHRLYQHGGKCEYFHGHNYIADFYVTGESVDHVGRIIDFAELKRLFKGWLDEHWDHGFLLDQKDENGINAIKSVTPTKYFLLPYNPTAENMAKYLLETVCPQLLAGTGLRAVRVVVWETEETCCEARVDPQE
jgi:6-pyruvoyltetrahydropterin/6-carboxytetrahydropterin synthase